MATPSTDPEPHHLQWFAHCPTTTTPTLRTHGIVCPFTDTFRTLALLVPPSSLVLEIGCSYGKCTRVLANTLSSPSQVIGIDISKQVLASASLAYPELTFLKADCLRDPMSTSRIHQQLCLDHPHLSRKNLVVFVDIGGNRELESLVALLPWIERHLCPNAIVVKSEQLHAAVLERCGGAFDWAMLQDIAAEAVTKRRTTDDGKRRAEVTKKNVRNGEQEDGKTLEGCEGDQRMARTKAGVAAGVAQCDVVPVIKKLHPLKAPLRNTPEGLAICRFHNYDERGCFKFIDPSCTGESCPYDHVLCHICLKKGHRALECALGAPLI